MTSMHTFYSETADFDTNCFYFSCSERGSRYAELYYVFVWISSRLMSTIASNKREITSVSSCYIISRCYSPFGYFYHTKVEKLIFI